MRLLTDAFEYNAWATRQLGDICRELTSEQLTTKEEWQYQPIFELWWHIGQVERRYLQMMGAAEPGEPEESLESLMAASEEARDAYVRFAGGLDDAALQRVRDPVVRKGVRGPGWAVPVLAHSIEHRADIAHFLSRLGYKTPPIDYIAWVYVKDGGKMPE